MSDHPKVVFICKPFLPELTNWLQMQPCDFWAPSMDIEDWGLVSKYDLGLNFMGTQKIPAGEVNQNVS